MPNGTQELKGLTLALAWGSLLSCMLLAQEAARTSYIPGTNFENYHTYTWVVVKGGTNPDPTVDAQIRQSIDAQLAAKGLTKKDSSADLNVDYQIAVTKAKKWETYEDWTNTGLPGQPDRGTRQREVTIEAGTLAVDMYDAAAKSLVWTGRVHKVLDPQSSKEARQKSIDKAAQELLEDFPPK